MGPNHDKSKLGTQECPVGKEVVQSPPSNNNSVSEFESNSAAAIADTGSGTQKQHSDSTEHPQKGENNKDGKRKSNKKTSGFSIMRFFKSVFLPMFKKCSQHSDSNTATKRRSSHRHSSTTATGAQHRHHQRVRGGVMLTGCHSAQEHYHRVRCILEAVESGNQGTRLRSTAGLAAAGLEYRFIQCPEHGKVPGGEEKEGEISCLIEEPIRGNADGGVVESPIVAAAPNSVEVYFSSRNFSCQHRLVHIDSNTVITEKNRKQFIADGEMYEVVARLCQEHAIDIMCKEGGLEWVTIETEEDVALRSLKHNNREPIQALVNSSHPLLHRRRRQLCQKGSFQTGVDGQDDGKVLLVDRPTLLIATGKGKVRAGIFSRQHLMCSGIECCTAVPMVREALAKRLNVVIVDPNCHGDRLGFCTFQKTMDYMSEYFSVDCSSPANQQVGDSLPPERCRDLYVLSHSSSGGHLLRYLLENNDRSKQQQQQQQRPFHLPNIRAIAFTDSTHNVQWAVKANREELSDMFESARCIYFRYSNPERDGSGWRLHSTGDIVQTDQFWKHRFGNIRTCWAGTKDHSLTNWYAHDKIWEHFDQYL